MNIMKKTLSLKVFIEEVSNLIINKFNHYDTTF